MTFARRLYFHGEEKRAVDFIALKNRSPLAEFEPANIGSNSKHANY
jgi:hypothetical protein